MQVQYQTSSGKVDQSFQVSFNTNKNQHDIDLQLEWINKSTNQLQLTVKSIILIKQWIYFSSAFFLP